MRTTIAMAAITAGLTAALIPSIAMANQSGLAGYSGKPNPTAPAGETCAKCHAGGGKPTVTLRLP